MKTKDLKQELKKLDKAALNARARGIAEELMKLRFRNASGQLTQGHRIGELKRNLARVLGAISARTVDAGKAKQA